MAARKSSPRSGREVATRALATAAARFPDLPPVALNTAGLTPLEASLAVAIHRTALRRWLTLEHIAGRFVKQPMWRLEPAMRAVLLAGAAQLLFMDRLPAYAVVDEMVALARRLVRPKAAGMVNGVLRNVARLVDRHAADEPWAPAADRLPWYADTPLAAEPGGAADAAPAATAEPAARAADAEDVAVAGTLHLKQAVLPDPADTVAHLSLATSVPEPVVRHWLDAFGHDRTVQLCAHSLKVAPTIVAVEPGFDATAASEQWLPHEQPGFIVWQGSHDQLVAFLAGSPHRRVQDPASARPILAVRELPVATVLDYCAGRGTKARQLAVLHPEARVFATDVNPDRLDELQQAAGALPNIEVLPIEQVRERWAGPTGDGDRAGGVTGQSSADMPTAAPGGGGVDLLLLDVPCSNTAVLARRPEARYRLTRKATHNLLELQRQIAREALPTLSPAGHVLYSTCSVDEAENQRQARWLAKQVTGRIVREEQMFPGGAGPTYHDGSYHALIAVGESG